MRPIPILALLVASAGLAGASETAGGNFPITGASPRAVREFQAGLRALYSGHPADAEREFEAALRRDPACAPAEWGLSRALFGEEKRAGATRAAARAEELAAAGDSREQRLTGAWAAYLKALSSASTDRAKALDQVRRDLDITLALYPDDVDAWLLRGEVAGSPLRTAPFYLAALRLEPDHPLGQVWKPSAPPVPQLTPVATQPVKDVSDALPLFPGLGNLHFPVTTQSPETQEYFDQGMRCYHAYVLPGYVKNSAAADFQHAAALDPTCAMAYWGLSFCGTPAMKQADAANRALELAQRYGSDKERRYAAARVLELAGPQKREQFLDALDGAIAVYPDDVELWIWRGKVYGQYVAASDSPESLPYELAAVRMHPEHPAPNHELIHLYEAIDRPALGWPFTVGFRQSAPNMPHANHMQAHLAMRLGRWQDAIDCTRLSRQKSLEGFPELDPSHHADILIRALAHEGRFAEAEKEPAQFRAELPWTRLLQLKADPEALGQWGAERRAKERVEGQYIGALARLEVGDVTGAQPFVAAVEAKWKDNAREYYAYREVRGRWLVQSGSADEGLKLLREAGKRAVKDSSLHAWGGGSYMLEVWGEAALRAHRLDDAEEAFLEALAHEHGSIVGALGMQVVWERRGRADMAAHFAGRAGQIWKDADPGALDRQLARLRRAAAG